MHPHDDLELSMDDIPEHFEAGELKRAQIAIVESARQAEAARKPESIESVLLYAPFTDLGNAERLAAMFGHKLRFCHPWGKWLCWDGARWRVDDTAEVIRCAKLTVRRMFELAVNLHNTDTRDALLKHARQTEKNARIAAMLTLCAAEIGIPVLPDQLDAPPWLLNVQNGTIDLQTGKLLPHDPANLLTKLAPVTYDPGALCPTWLAFQSRIMGRDAEIIAFKQRCFGYALTGKVEKRAVFIFYGPSNAGKTTELEALRDMLGDYAGQLRIESLMEHRHSTGSGPSPDIADLRGLRLVVSSEPAEGAKLSDAKLKHLTGMGRIKARRLHEEHFEFLQTWKLFLDCNFLPNLRGDDPAVWNRVGLIDFQVQIPEDEIDRDLPSKLRAELPGILAWAVTGCLAWQAAGGLTLPERVKSATTEYRTEMDSLKRFIEENCEVGDYFSCRGNALYGAYRRYCEQVGERAQTMQTFGTELPARGFLKTRDRQGVKYTGLTLRSSDGDDL